jgi:hypothetical protein
MVGKMFYQVNDEKISPEEVKYWKRMFKSNLKIGVEIETELSENNDYNRAIRELENVFNPTDSFGEFGQHGVYTVKSDGSLPNGIELCTIGRRLDFLDLYMQYKGILHVVYSYNPVMNQRAGLHNHVLMDYNSNGSCLEKPVPGVIFKNFCQLLRRYLPELVWITSTLNIEGSDVITRYDKFCSAEKLIQYTSINRTVEDYCKRLYEQGEVNSRYRFVNCLPMRVIGNDINTFHFELRFPDGSIYPCQIAAQNMLYFSMLVKAIELSELGVINAGNVEYWNETKELYNAIRNNRNSDRTSVPPTEEQIERIKERCSDMLLELKSSLDQFDKHIYPLLDLISKEPVSMLRRSKSDGEINEYFDSIVKSMYNINLSDCSDIISMINLIKVNKCNSRAHWASKVAEELSLASNEIERRLFKLEQIRPMEFDQILGSMVFK